MKPEVLKNPMGQPIDSIVDGWTPRPTPPRNPMEGRFVILEPFDIKAHADGLFKIYAADKEGRLWTYMMRGPFEDLADYQLMAEGMMIGNDPLFHTIIDKSTNALLGEASYMRIKPANGCIEVGNIVFGPTLQRTPGATEAMFLMARRAFDELGYRRYEWKCNALNAPSRRAALRLGFTYEGTFRKHEIAKGRNRDTSWYAMTDDDWPRVKANFETWLAPENFDADGKQRQSLSTLNGSGA